LDMGPFFQIQSNPWMDPIHVQLCGGFGQRWGRNGEFCVAVGPAIRNAGILAQVG